MSSQLAWLANVLVMQNHKIKWKNAFLWGTVYSKCANVVGKNLKQIQFSDQTEGCAVQPPLSTFCTAITCTILCQELHSFRTKKNYARTHHMIWFNMAVAQWGVQMSYT